jgi:hypothetical protein
VILREPNAPETWLATPTEEALKLQRPLPDWSLKIAGNIPGRGRN